MNVRKLIDTLDEYDINIRHSLIYVRFDSNPLTLVSVDNFEVSNNKLVLKVIPPFLASNIVDPTITVHSLRSKLDKLEVEQSAVDSVLVGLFDFDVSLTGDHVILQVHDQPIKLSVTCDNLNRPNVYYTDFTAHQSTKIITSNVDPIYFTIHVGGSDYS